MFQDVSDSEYKRLHKISVRIIRNRLPSNVGIDSHDLAHESLEHFYSSPGRSSLWYSIIDALRSRYGRGSRAFLDRVCESRSSYTDRSFDIVDANLSLLSIYNAVEHKLSRLERDVLFAILEDKSMAELSRETGYTESYYSYIRKDLVEKLRSVT